MPKNSLPVVVLAAWLLALLAPPASAVKLGVMGDSLSDEYAEESYGLYADNWVEQLVNYGGIDVGPIGAWGGPRRNFYEYNWARSGATSSTLLSAGQHTGLAGQVGPDSIDYAVLMIGANDQFDGSNAYLNIYQGLWSPAQINNWVNGVVANIDTALSTVVPTGVKLALFNSPDYGVTPAVKSSATSAAGRQAVADVIANQLNPAIEALAVAHQVAYVDLGAALAEMFGPHTSPNSTLSIGNVNINLNSIDTSIGSNPTAGFVHDGVHPNTTLQGLIANLALEALNIGYGANLPLFTEQEILAHRGIAYGGSDTLASQIGDYSVYITSYVPEPSSCALAGLAAVALAVVARRRRKAA